MLAPRGRIFRVEAPVTRRSPHRPVREDFPHTVPRSPQALRQWRTQQATPRWAHNFAILQFCPDARCCELFWVSIEERFV